MSDRIDIQGFIEKGLIDIARGNRGGDDEDFTVTRTACDKFEVEFNDGEETETFEFDGKPSEILAMLLDEWVDGS